MNALQGISVRLAQRLIFGSLILAVGSQAAEERHPGKILVATAAAGDYIIGAGGTLAQFALEGYDVHVAQFGNDEKDSAGLSPAETRLANVQQARAAGEYLGVTDTVSMDHKSGETGHISSTEMRKQLFALIRHLRPTKIFIPDGYVHFLGDWDQYYVGRMAEEAWGYSGGGTFANELERMGLKPYSVPEVYYYTVGRPYRPREGGEQDAGLMAVDIGSVMETKVRAMQLMHTRNRVRAMETRLRLQAAGKPLSGLELLDESAVKELARAWVAELGKAIGAKHGFEYGEEFNYVGRGEELPPHVMRRAVPK